MHVQLLILNAKVDHFPLVMIWILHKVVPAFEWLMKSWSVIILFHTKIFWAELDCGTVSYAVHNVHVPSVVHLSLSCFPGWNKHSMRYRKMWWAECWKTSLVLTWLLPKLLSCSALMGLYRSFCPFDPLLVVAFLDTQMCAEILVEHYASTAVYFIFMSKTNSCRS